MSTITRKDTPRWVIIAFPVLTYYELPEEYKPYVREVLEVVVGNVGTVYDGTDWGEALQLYERYCTTSRRGLGSRAYQETVALLHNGDIAREHIGEVDLHE